MKYVLAKDLPFAKAGSEIIIGESAVSVKTPEYGSASRSFLGYRSEIDRLIAEGWIKEVKPRELWANRYRGEDDIYHKSKEDADNMASENRLECIHYREVLE